VLVRARSRTFCWLKEEKKTAREVALNLFPRVAKEPNIGWTPIMEDNFHLNPEVYQSKFVRIVPLSSIKGLAIVRKYDDLKQQSANFYGMMHLFILRFRESLRLKTYEHVGPSQCLPFPTCYKEMGITSCAAYEISVSLDNVKVCLNKMFVE
jgi:hypothetical protein